MRDLFKRTIALLLCGSMVLNSYSSEVKASNQNMNAYVLDIIDDMLYINGYDETSNIYISNDFPVYNLEGVQNDKRIYFIFEDDNIIAMLIVESIDGEYYSSLELSVPEEIKKIYKSGDEFALCSYDGCFIIHTDTQNIMIETVGLTKADVDSLDYSDALFGNITKRIENVMYMVNDVSSEMYSISSGSGAYTVDALLVPYVKNEVAATGKWLCWAASVASISNYKTGTDYTAKRLHDKLWTKYSGYGSDDYPVGNARWVKRAFETCGLDYTYEERGLNGKEVSDALSKKRPIYMSLGGSDSNGNHKVHAIVLQGIYVNYGGKNMYQIMDCNRENSGVNNIITVTVSDSALDHAKYFKYVTGTTTYDSWYLSFY